MTKKTTVLVVGEWATVTSKEKRARELQDKGQDIQIWQADQLLQALGVDESRRFKKVSPPREPGRVRLRLSSHAASTTSTRIRPGDHFKACAFG